MPDLGALGGWASDFSTHLNKLANDDLGVNTIQTAYDGLSWTTTTQDGQQIFTQLRSSFEAKIKQRVDALRALKEDVEAGYARNSGSTAHEMCCNVHPVEFDPQFKAKVDLTKSCMTTPSGNTPPSNDLRAMNTLDTQFQTNRGSSRTMKWQYFGSEEGSFKIFPAANGDCGNYDPRYRPWYVLGATPAPKDIVIVVDSSGSMGAYGRMSLAKAAAQVVLDTLSPHDYVNIVDFDSSAKSLSSPSCFASGLARATGPNRKLLSDFISGMTASGGTYYNRALELAFNMINQAVNAEATTGGTKAILFLTDGVPAESNSEILNYISANNAHNAKILTYAFGAGVDGANVRTLLQSMATDTGGRFEAVPDGGDLRAAMGGYYNFFASTNTNPPPVWTAPYWDSSGLGMVVTAALPVFYGGNLKGVVGVDLTIEDLVSDVAYFNAGEYSFAFVTDDVGTVLMHPLLPTPQFASADAIQLDLSQLETGSAFRTNVRNPMVAGQNGSYAMTLTRALSRGDARTEGVAQKALPYTFYYAPIASSNLRVAIALANTDVSLRTISGTGALSAADASIYHRIDLASTSNSAKCNQVGQIATKEATTWKLAPDAFKSPALYLEVPETTADVNMWENWVKGVVSSPPLDLLDKDAVKRDIIASNVGGAHWLSTVSGADSVAGYTVWRYFGSSNGVFRMFPGSPSKPLYNPMQRPWYSRALTNKGSNAISTPYEDANGAGTVITLSKAVLANTGVARTNDDAPAGVLGMDFTLGLFWQLMVDNTGCSDTLKDGSNTVTCFVMDESGYVVVHPDFISSTTPAARLSDTWIGEMYPKLAEKLLDVSAPVLSSHTCNAFETVEQNLFYTSQTRGSDGASGTLSCGAKYTLSVIPSTNTYLVAVSDASGYSCLKTSSACYCGSGSSSNLCKCPGSSPLTFNTCATTFTLTSAQQAAPTCPPPPVTREFVSNVVPASSSMAKCFATSCSDQTKFLDCYGRVGCNWCEFGNDGQELPPADWYCSDNKCPLPGTRGPNAAPAAATTASLLLAAAVTAVAVLRLR